MLSPESCAILLSDTACPFAKLAADTTIPGAELAKLLAHAISTANDWYEFFAINRFQRNVYGALAGCTLASVLEGKHFWQRFDTTSAHDFEAAKELAWLYREQADF